MKKTISITIGGLNFQIEEDAYSALEKYLGEIKTRFSSYADAAEIVGDMEDRIAEQFSGKIRNGQPVTLAMVENLILIMGRPDQIGEAGKAKTGPDTESAPKAPPSAKRMFRNLDDAILGGVCSGVAAYLGMDTVWVRLIFALTVFFGGFGVVLYIILWVIVPPAETDTEKLQMRGSPVNLKNLEQTVKDRVAEIKKKDRGQIKRGLAAPFRAFGALFGALGGLFKRLLRVLFKILGVFITVVAALAMAGLVFAAVSLLMNSGSPYVDFPLQEIASGAVYYLAMASAFFVVFVPIVFIILLGTSLAAYRSTFTRMGSFMLLGLWVVALAVFANMAIRLAPQVETLVNTSPYFQVASREFELKDFSALEIGGMDEVVIYPGSGYMVVAEARQKDLDQTKIFVQNNILKVEKRHVFRFCLFCARDKVKLAVYAPSFTRISGSGASRIATAGTLNGKNLKIELSGVSNLRAGILAESADVRVSGAAKSAISGSIDILQVSASGAGRFEATEARVKRASLDLSGASQAHLGDLEYLKVRASGASTLYYQSAGSLDENYSGASRSVKRMGSSITFPEPGGNPPVLRAGLAEPVSGALERITKKPFGLKISPQNSPVSPERFSGYHTGVDFEIFPEEQGTEVQVYAVCEGPLAQKRFVSGYGGVAIQRCKLEGRDITVIYGHLKLDSINHKTGEQILIGSRLGILGKGLSAETDGERKHLHLGIHLGSEINLAGYVKQEPDLANWLDAAKYVK